MENSGWINSQESLPNEGEQILTLDFTVRDIVVDWTVFRNGKFHLITGGYAGIPAFWRRDVKLPEIVLKTVF